MPRFPGFIGPSAVERSVALDAERTINFYPRASVPGVPKSPLALYATPGLRVFATLDGHCVYGLWSQDERCFAVAGPRFYEILRDGSSLYRGAVAENGEPATLVSNGVGGHQLLVIAGEVAYCYDLTTDTFAAIEAEHFDRAMMGDYIDGYFVLMGSAPGMSERILCLSALNDGTSWDPLDVAQVSSSSNRVLALIADHRELWLFGSRTSEIWINTGDNDFPFGPLQGTFIQFGIRAAYSVARLDNTLFWVGGDERGAGKVYKMNGYVPQRVSTHAVEYALGKSAVLGDAVAWTYDEEGHVFYCLYVPDLETTWVYDVATGLWHERAVWDPVASRWEPHRGRCHCFAFNTYHLVGDRASGVVYEQALTYYDEEIPT